MKLFMHPGACSLSPHIVSRELGLGIELVEVDRATHRTADGSDYLAINPNGYVPALQLNDGTVLTEGPAIVQFLAELAGGSSLLRAGGIERGRTRSWLNFITSELHKPMSLLFSKAYQGAHEELRALVGRRLDYVEAELGEPFLEGSEFSAPDAYLFVCLNWTPWIGIDLSRWLALERFMEAVAARAGVQAALEAEGLVPAQGVFFAPRADHRQVGVRP